jgi:hypothetical protein
MTGRRAGARVAALLAAAAAACAERPLVPGEPHVVDRIVVAPYAAHEECASLAAGDRLDYRYESTAPLDFGIRYREEGSVLSPLVREHSTGDGGTFVVRAARDYCLAWQAGPEGAIIGYRMLVHRGARH